MRLHMVAFHGKGNRLAELYIYNKVVRRHIH